MLQTIYLDTLICVNIFIDYLILKVTQKTLHINTTEIRIISGAIVGGASVLIVFIPIYNCIFSYVFKFISSAIIIITSFGYSTFRKLIIRTLTYFGISMVIFALVILIELAINPIGVVIYNDTLYFDISPALLIICTLITYLILSIYRKTNSKHIISRTIRSVTIYIKEDKKITFESAVDTGCNLKEPFSGLPVIVVEKEILNYEITEDNNMRVIPVNTLIGSDIIMGFRPEKVYIDNTELKKGCYIGISENKLKGEVKSLMSVELSEAVL